MDGSEMGGLRCMEELSEDDRARVVLVMVAVTLILMMAIAYDAFRNPLRASKVWVDEHLRPHIEPLGRAA